MRLAATTFRLHRWLGWIVGLQVLLWVLGGLVFSALPFQAWVKAGDTILAPVAVLPSGWAERVSPALLEAGAVDALAVVATPHGPALRLALPGRARPLMVPADGSDWRTPDATAVAAFASALHRTAAPVLDVVRLAEAPRRLGLVDEMPGRRDLWRVRFDDGLGTRVYLDGETGAFLAARTDAWVWYDFFWRLHIMDYGGGEDFNGVLLRVAAVLAFALVVAGAVLGVLAARRRWRQHAR